MVSKFRLYFIATLFFYFIVHFVARGLPRASPLPSLLAMTGLRGVKCSLLAKPNDGFLFRLHSITAMLGYRNVHFVAWGSPPDPNRNRHGSFGRASLLHPQQASARSG